ncbi:DNA primase [Thioalkalivibrio sp. HK1]|uniref:DNA primase n=1 Tax=Thioalkalivibrio sp. HK1 TaxID=1469245 RepID=UPI00046FADEF|nr:DNA primase [Thioalkalivibrio sp. HK1]
MAGRIPRSFVDDILARTDIAEIIGHYIRLVPSGKEFKSLCPFHSEKTPSFTVVPDKQFYHCFGCGKSGSAIGFLMDYANMDFVEAVEDLAHRLGLKVPHEVDDRRFAADGDHRAIFEMLERANRFFRNGLRGSDVAKEYLKGRGLGGEVAREFQIGFAPSGWEALLSELGKEASERDLLVAAGLVIRRQEDGRLYDRFRNRITFPIHDTRGRVVGFGARIIGVGEPKYLNSPETRVFHKGRELYGLWRLRRPGVVRPKRLLVVEGYMDVVGLARSGIDGAVATLGTSATPDHIRSLFRFAGDIVFCFDGDEAGRRAAWRALENTLPAMHGEDRQVRFLFLPEGEDPDSLARIEGREAFERRLQDDAIEMSRFLFEQKERDLSLRSAEGRSRLVARLLPLIRRIPSGGYRRQLEMELADLSKDRTVISFDESVVEGYRPPGRSGSKFSDRAAGGPKRSGPSKTLMRQAVRILVYDPQVALDVEDEDLEPIRDDAADLRGADILLDLIENIRRRPDISAGRLRERYRGHRWEGAILALSRDPPELFGKGDMKIEFEECLRRLREQAKRRKRRARREALSSGSVRGSNIAQGDESPALDRKASAVDDETSRALLQEGSDGR